MKAALASNPALFEAKSLAQNELAKSSDRAQVMGYVTKSVVVVSCLAMMYCLISYGRIFENYLQW